MKYSLSPILFASVLLLCGQSATTRADEASDRDTLRSMLGAVEQAINDRDVTNVLDFFTPTSIVAFPDSTVHTGPQEVQTYFDKMLGTSDSVLTDIKSNATLSGPASFYGPDTAVAHGTLLGQLNFRGGADIKLESVWTTTVTRLDGQWRVASLHISANIFNNPLIHSAKRSLIWVGLIGSIAGFLLTWLFMRRKKKYS